LLPAKPRAFGRRPADSRLAGGNRVLPDLARSGDTDSLLLARLPDCHDAVHLWWLGELPEAQLVAVLTGLLWIMHWPNISRLLAGAENKIGKPTASLKTGASPERRPCGR
jgi:hypothetical protein